MKKLIPILALALCLGPKLGWTSPQQTETAIAATMTYVVSSYTPTFTPTITPDQSPTNTPALSATPTATPTATPSSTPTPFYSSTPTWTPTPTPTWTPTPSPTWTPTPTPTWTPTATRTTTPTVTLTITRTFTFSPTITQTNTPNYSPTPTFTPTVTRTVTVTPTLVPWPINPQVQLQGTFLAPNYAVTYTAQGTSWMLVMTGHATTQPGTFLIAVPTTCVNQQYVIQPVSLGTPTVYGQDLAPGKNVTESYFPGDGLYIKEATPGPLSTTVRDRWNQ